MSKKENSTQKENIYTLIVSVNCTEKLKACDKLFVNGIIFIPAKDSQEPSAYDKD